MLAHTSPSHPWPRRIAGGLGVLVSAFIALFALDAVQEGFVPFFLHLVPAMVLLATVVLAWRWPWLGALVFLGLAVFYASQAIDHPTWILAISGPLALVGLANVWSWRAKSTA